MRKEEKEERSLQGDYTNVLVWEFKPFAIKRLSEQNDLLILIMDELKSECAIFDKLLNEVMSYLYMFSSRMLNKIFKDINGIGIVTKKEEFLHPHKLGAIATGNNLFNLGCG